MTDRASVPVLIVEDDGAMVRLVRHLLELEGYRRVHHVWSGEQALAAAAEAEIILLDQNLPDLRGLDLLPRLLARPHPPSVIMVTAHGSESLAAAALRQGAEDYLTKDHTFPELLPRILERVRRARALRQTLAAAEEELVRSERLAAIGEMAVSLHHEVNNPLMAALAEVDLALGEASLPAHTREGLATVRAALLRIRDTLRRSADLRHAASTDYLGGTRRIELRPDPAREPPYRGRAVLDLPEPRLARAVSLLLRDAGFEVERSPSAADARSAAEAVGVTLVVLAAEADPQALLDAFRCDPGRGYTLVVLGAEHADLMRSAGADLVLALPFDPETVAAEILAAMGNRMTSHE